MLREIEEESAAEAGGGPLGRGASAGVVTGFGIGQPYPDGSRWSSVTEAGLNCSAVGVLGAVGTGQCMRLSTIGRARQSTTAGQGRKNDNLMDAHVKAIVDSERWLKARLCPLGTSCHV